MAYYLSNLNNNEKYETNQSYNSTKVFNSKLVLLGDTSVGKSCIVVRFAKNEFYEYQESTIGAAFMTQLIDIGECTIKFEIWDTAGLNKSRKKPKKKMFVEWEGIIKNPLPFCLYFDKDIHILCFSLQRLLSF
ncbi:hypothetical protein PFMG_01643 [Plasmodium falciparum IGH-CR14]|uniref:Uncharacterized protein n=1 Tax=Plasmodium falciparum IGH-CR14 TaxID=580059 RepID=A0A0L1I8D0_PLAFA|nr:hypothetical protein PFMG_01643 [Plasmodium falciparum IGH-CR14]